MSIRGFGDKLVGAIIRRRHVVGLLWAISAVLLVPNARRIESVLSVAARVEGSESAEVEEQLAHRFQSPFAHSMVLVASGVRSPATTAGRVVLRALVDSLRAAPGVTRVLSYLDGGDRLFVGSTARDTGGTFLVVGLDERRRPDQLLDTLRLTTQRLSATLGREMPGAVLWWTGEAALNADLRRMSAADARRAEWRALPLTVALLLVAFGALAAALLPTAGAMLAIGISLGAAALIGEVLHLSILLQNVVTMIGLGLGIDYSLLVVQRFREVMRFDLGREIAAREALRHAGPTILLSGVAVAIGFGALAVVPVNELRSVAVGGLLVTVASMLIATTLLPGVLATLGARVDLGRLPLRDRISRTGPPEITTSARDERAPAQAAAASVGARTWWESWAAIVTRYPGRVLLVAGLPVCVLAWEARRLHTDQPRGDWLPKHMESAEALRALNAMGRGAVVQTIRLTIELPPGVSALDESGWAATVQLARRLVADSGVARVRSLPGLLAPFASTLPRDVLIAELADDVRRTFVSRDGRLALVEVIPREGLGPAELSELVKRARVVGGPRVHVGGLPALNVDYQQAVAGSGQLRRVIVLVVSVTLLVLALGFRSILVPMKAIVLNLLAVAAAFGAVTLVFQDGIGARLLGLDGPLDGIFPTIPVLVFCVVFGLSMDYEVFLVARVREARCAGAGERVAIAHGLGHTGRLITTAAAIMITVFGAFMFGAFLLMKMLGFALAGAVLLDATVMRLAVSPALLTLAGRWNWWPGERLRDGSRATAEAAHSLVTQRSLPTAALPHPPSGADPGSRAPAARDRSGRTAFG